jgi:hypothetical protein
MYSYGTAKGAIPSRPRRTVIYARVSTREQAEEGYSLDSQIEGCRTYYRAMGWPCPALEDTVWTALRDLLLDPERVFAEAEALADAATVQARQLANEVTALEAKRASLGAQQEKLLDCYLRAAATPLSSTGAMAA